MPCDIEKPVVLCDDKMLGYERSRTVFADGEGLRLDDAYCLAHLPLIAPDHPDVIPRKPGTGYEMGRHEPVSSIVIPVEYSRLLAAPAFKNLLKDLQAASFAPKIAWDLLDRRAARVHATVCRVGDIAPQKAMSGVRPFQIELRGLFSGQFNLGRMYLKVYPECRNGENILQDIQSRLGQPQSDLYLAGLFNFTDHLSAGETEELRAIQKNWWDRPVLTMVVDRLWLLSARDDLVLDSTVAETISLT